MKQRWLEFWKRSGAGGDAALPWGVLSARYAEPHRAYHTLGHIAHCLEELDSARDLALDPVAVELALWYHDVVYDPRSKDNEQQSADLAAAAAVAMGFSAARARRVADLILVSTHQALAVDPDAQLFADIDLAILGQPAAVFDQYERQVRVEYAWVPDELFRAGRSAILKSFLDRPSIYATPFFGKKYEAAARRNLSESLLRWS